jgi:hypothetical protein
MHLSLALGTLALALSLATTLALIEHACIAEHIERAVRLRAQSYVPNHTVAIQGSRERIHIPQTSANFASPLPVLGSSTLAPVAAHV